MALFLLIVSTLYALFTITLWLTWQRIPTVVISTVGSPTTRITVVIPVRNEAGNIENLLHDLAQQTYQHFEVIVADDSSTDNTLTIVEAYARTAPFILRPLFLADERTASPKKRAITQSIALATGDLIVTTDGDCRVGPNWLASLAAFYEKTGAKLISGPVTFTRERTVFDGLQTVEFASLIGTGACTMALGYPTMCNGANLCYEKKVFVELGGFAGVDHLASGDDEFLMHKVAASYPASQHPVGHYPVGHYPVVPHPVGVQFLKSSDAIVRTQPHQSWRAFYNQRKRWASKWRAYQTYWPSVLAVFVFLSNAAPILAIVGWLLGFLNGNTALIVMVIKVLPEFLFLRRVLVFLQKKSSVGVIPLTQLVYPFYVLFFGLAAQGKGYSWKGRKLE